MPPKPGHEGDDVQADPDFAVTPEQLQQLMASGNPQLVAALQRGLNRLVGTSSGYIESLPKPVQRRIEYLRGVEEERNELEEQFQEERRALEQKYAKLYEPLYAKRAEVVSGAVEVPDNETEEAKAEMGEAPAGIPDFWRSALINHPDIAEQVTEKDAEVLNFLQDLKEEQLTGEEEGFRLVFTFGDNPFFSNKQLVKTYVLEEEDGETMLSSIQGTEIQWAAGKDVTVKVMKKKPKPGAKASAKPQTKTEPVESFFRWFAAPEMPDDEAQLEEEELEALQEDMHADYELAQIIKSDILPHAVSWFTGEALQEDSDEEEEEEEDEDEDGDEEEDESEEEEEGEGQGSKRMAAAQKGPTDAAQQPQECKQQ